MKHLLLILGLIGSFFITCSTCFADIAAAPLGPDQIVPTTPASHHWYPEITTLSNGDYVIVWETSNSQVVSDNGFSIRGRRFNSNGIPQGTEFAVNTTTADDQELPAIAALANGGFVVVWFDDSQKLPDNTNGRLLARLFDATATPSSGEILIGTMQADYRARVGVSGLQNGKFVVSWTQWPLVNGSNTPIMAQVFNQTGSSSGSSFVVSDLSMTINMEPSVTTLASGDFVITWTGTSPLTDRDVYGRVFQQDGSPQTGQFMINSTVTADEQEEARVAALTDGGFVVTFIDSSPQPSTISGDYYMMARRFDAALAPMGPDFIVNTTQGAPDIYEPSVAGLSGGGYVITWWDDSQTGADMDEWAVRARIYDECGGSGDQDFLVNSTYDGRQLIPVITGLATGGFVVAFDDHPGPSNNPGPHNVRQRLFAAPISDSGSCSCSTTTAMGMTWGKMAVHAPTGVVRVGCNGNCNPFVGDTVCSTALPLLCINKTGAQKPVSLPASSGWFHKWSNGVVGTTDPVAACNFVFLSEADAFCAAEFGPGWRVAEFHDGAGHSLWAFGNTSTNATRYWTDINDQANGVCWQR